MREHPILFSAPMVRAILDGRKTQTRRIVSPQPEQRDPSDGHGDEFMWPSAKCRSMVTLDEMRSLGPYGARGDRLWVREAFTHITGNGIRVHYRADGEPTDREGRVLPTEPGLRRWWPSIHMPRSASRITLEISEVRVQRLHDITEDDARAEGVEPFFTRFPDIGRDQRLNTGELCRDAEHRAAFAVLWVEINGDRALWISNPWVWAVTFKRVEPA